jgi:hypothetical protein
VETVPVIAEGPQVVVFAARVHPSGRCVLQYADQPTDEFLCEAPRGRPNAVRQSVMRTRRFGVA